MIPEAHEHLSFLMGADAITDDDLTNLGVKILERYGSASRGLLVPAASLSLYSALVRERLSAGFWNEIVGRQEILFIFKLPNGTVREVEQTSNLPRYLSGNPLYGELIAAFYASELS